eukprot:TRINITY_DN22731_c0_g1_i1.p1 TRINITY_DN22731_c0_g1~~TRINITY_DN22731_c0_g1_i1.p1  ORF type:complete len:157 (-),score=3.07 TRINITY_DN22731_c0_g1_i1:63-533(-)
MSSRKEEFSFDKLVTEDVVTPTVIQSSQTKQLKIYMQVSFRIIILGIIVAIYLAHYTRLHEGTHILDDASVYPAFFAILMVSMQLFDMFTGMILTPSEYPITKSKSNWLVIQLVIFSGFVITAFFFPVIYYHMVSRCVRLCSHWWLLGIIDEKEYK